LRIVRSIFNNEGDSDIQTKMARLLDSHYPLTNHESYQIRAKRILHRFFPYLFEFFPLLRGQVSKILEHAAPSHSTRTAIRFGLILCEQG